MNKKIIGTIAVVAMIALAGCSVNPGETGEELENDTGQNIESDWPGESYAYEVRATEDNQLHLIQKRPPFQMDDSLERQNLIQRYKYLNDANNVHHVYAMSNDGKVIAYWTAQGKVSSVNSKLTNNKQVIRVPNCDSHNEGNDCWKVVESPQMDGSYGTNGNAIFFFTTEGKYVEWNGKYVVSEEPMNIQTAVSLEQDVGEDDDNSSDS